MRQSWKDTPRLAWFWHAFHIEDAASVEVTPDDQVLIDRFSREIVRRRLTTPALLFLEMHRPFNYLSAQAMHLFEPLVSVVFDASGYRGFARFLEQRGSIDHLIKCIEKIEKLEKIDEIDGVDAR